MITYIPSNTPTSIKTEGYIRQNPYECVDDKLESVILSNKIHIPKIHGKDNVDYMNQNGGIISPDVNGYSYAQIAKNFLNEELVHIPDGKKGLIVRLISSMKTGILNTLCIACTPRDCGHNHIRSCDTCRLSVKEIFNPSNTEKLLKYLKDGCIIEPFYCAYRDIEIVGKVNLDGVNASSISGQASAAKYKNVRYWTLA